MIHPRAQKAERQHKGRRGQAKRLVKIGRILLGHPVPPIRADLGPRLGPDRIHITDHRFRISAQRQTPVRPTVCRHKMRRHCACPLKQWL